MKPSHAILLAATCLASAFVLPATAWSQTAQPSAAPQPDATPDTTTVTVTGKKKGDRDVYNVRDDPDAATGTAADALNKIPGVNVDPSGNVTLHGRNVVVYLNGRPSLMLSGDNRGAALRAMPSAYISTIEVISSPGAQYASGDGAPIININTQHNMPPGMFGSLSARYSSPAGSFATAFLGITRDKLSLTLIGSYLDNRMTARYGGHTTALDGNAAPTQASALSGEGVTSFHGPFLSANLQYDLGLNDVLAAAVTYNRMPATTTSLSQSRTTTAGGAVTNLFDQTGRGTFISESDGLTVNYVHYGRKPDETLKLDASLARSASQNDSLSANTYRATTIPANIGTRFQAYDQQGDRQTASLHAEYNTPVGDDQLTWGAQLDVDDNATTSHVFGPGADTTALPANPRLTDDFRAHQVVSAVYATWQRELTPRWTVLVGLRGEALDLTTRDLTYNTDGQVGYTRFNPSLFATYVLSPARKLRFSYTHRQQRPEAADLNPHSVYASDTSVNAGNPHLKPQENDALEARYEVSLKDLNYTVLAFWRGDTRTIATISQIIPDPQGLGNIVAQSTRVNAGRQSDTGLSGNVSRQFGNTWTLNADATLTRSQRSNPQIASLLSGTALNASLSLNHTFPKGDRIYVMYKITGKTFTTQGYTTGAAFANLQYSHSLTPKIDLEISVNDLFRQTRTITVIDTPLLQTRFVATRQSPTFMIGLSRHFSHFAPISAAGN